MKRKIPNGLTSVLDRIFIRSVSTTGLVTGMTNVSLSSATLSYCRAGQAASVPVSLSSAVLGTWQSGGFCQMDPVNMPGDYEIGIPNAAVQPGAPSVLFHFRIPGVIDEIPFQFELDYIPYQTPIGSSGSITTYGTAPGQISASGGIASANVVEIFNSASAAQAYQAMINATTVFQVSNDSAPTTTSFTTNPTVSPSVKTQNHFYDTPPQFLAFSSGVNQGKCVKIAASGHVVAGSVSTFTIQSSDILPNAPGVGDTGFIIGGG